MGKVFVSYSHRDREAFEELWGFLAPLHREGLLEAWSDERIETGFRWRTEIDAALESATAAVLLVTQRFVASDFIAKHELPRLLARAREGKVTVLPVFHSPADVSFGDYAEIPELQGFGTPDRPLGGRPGSEREAVYVELAQRLRELAAGPPPRPSAIVRPAGEVPRLAVTLELAGGKLACTYLASDGTVLGSTDLAWSEVERDVGVLAAYLDTGDLRGIGTVLSPAAPIGGASLFRLLFGDGEGRDWKRLLGSALGPNPLRLAVDLRICTGDAVLAGLPWRLASFRRQRLAHAGWRFAVADEPAVAAHVRVPAPATVLVVAPRAAADGAAAAFGEVLSDLWPGIREADHVPRVHTPAEVEAVLGRVRPQVVYLRGDRVAAAGEPCLQLDGPEPLPLGLLRQVLEAAGPAVLWADGAGPVHAGLPDPGQVLGGVVPLVVCRRLPQRTPDTAAQPVAWLRRWLDAGGDPLDALHEVTARRRELTPESATLSAYGRHYAWRTDGYRPKRARDPRLFLDRDLPKAALHKEVTGLVRNDRRRVLALVAFGAPGNHLHAVCEQLVEHLAGEADRVAEVDVERLQFPELRDDLRATLRAELRLQLGAGADEDLKAPVRRCAARVLHRGQRAVLWLDWGVFGEDAALHSPLDPKELDAWLRFCRLDLTAACPADRRIVSAVTLDVPKTKQDELRAVLAELRRATARAGEAAFRFAVLPEVGSVPLEELIDYLEDPANTTCPPGMHVDAADAILEATGGVFEGVVDHIREAEETSWHTLLKRLARGGSGAT